MIVRRARLAAIGLALACTHSPSTAPAPTTHPSAATRLPPVPVARGPLELKVVYPPADAMVDARDSSFIFGSAGAGDAELSINDVPVQVWPNGAWLAWVSLPRDSLMSFRIVARTPRDSAELVYTARRASRFTAPDGGLWIDSTSLAPQGRVWLGRGDYLTLGARVAQGAEVRLRLPDGVVIPLASDPRPDEVPAGVRAFDRDTLNLPTIERPDHYAGMFRGTRVGDPGPLFAPGQATAETPVLEAIRGADTVRVRWPLQIALLDTLPIVAELAAPAGPPNAVVVARAAPRTSYHWFFPTGTRAVVAGRRNDEIRLRLSEGVEAWVAAADVRALPPGTPVPRGVAGSIAVTPLAGSGGERASIRIPLGARVPFRVDEDDRRLTVTLYRTAGDVSWLRYGTGDSPVRRVTWGQEPGGRTTLAIDLTGPVWGYRTRWSGTDLILDVRRAPRRSGGRPLSGRLIVVDPGHPPGGSTGPTGLREAEANLAVALRLRALLEDAGARVVMTRTSDVPVDLGARPRLADSLDADLLVSIHNNALPDGVNPFTNNGTSVYYSQPRSLPLARAIQRDLVARFGVRDLGVGRADFALTRATWQPAVLCEGLYMIMPDQEAALRSAAGQELYARGVFEGIVTFMNGVNGER